MRITFENGVPSGASAAAGSINAFEIDELRLCSDGKVRAYKGEVVVEERDWKYRDVPGRVYMNPALVEEALQSYEHPDHSYANTAVLAMFEVPLIRAFSERARSGVPPSAAIVKLGLLKLLFLHELRRTGAAWVYEGIVGGPWIPEVELLPEGSSAGFERSAEYVVSNRGAKKT